MWELLQQLGRVPRRLIWDNESGIGRGKRHAEGVGAFTGTLATTLQRLKPNDPESKGLVERRNGFFETSFMPGRDFSSPADFDAQFAEWLTKANARVVRTIKTRPVDLLDADKGGDAAAATGRTGGRLGQPGPVGTRLLRPRRQQRLLRRPGGDRPVRRREPRTWPGSRSATRDVSSPAHDRVWARGMTITDPAHVAAAKVLREQYQRPRPAPDPGRGAGARPGRLRPRLRPHRRWRRRRRRSPMARWPDDDPEAKTERDASEALKQLTYLAAALKAPRITEAAARLADHARDAGWTHEEYLAAVLDREVAARNASGAQLRIRAAGFAARKTLEEFDWDAQPAVRQQIAALASGGFLTEARNVVLLGPPGTGKTHLATGLGIAAAHHGHRVLFATATEWVTRLTDAHRAGRLPQELARLRRYGLIIVDEVGYLPFEQDAANLFFQLVSSRYEHASLILTSNLPFSGWGGVFGDQAVAAAMIDRVVHHADVLTLKGASYRLRNRGIDTLPSIRTQDTAD